MPTIATLNELNTALRALVPRFTGFKMSPNSFEVCGQIDGHNIVLTLAEMMQHSSYGSANSLFGLCVAKIGNALAQDRAAEERCPHCGQPM